MWSKPGNPIAIDPSQVVVGLYVWLDIPWADHPFLTSRLMVRTPKEVAVIKASNPAGRLYYYPERSSVVPPPPNAARAAPAAAERAALAQEVEQRRQVKSRRQHSHSGAQGSASRNWDAAARATREALTDFAQSPRTAGTRLMQLSSQAAKAITHGRSVLLHLLGDKNGKGPYYHALNTMTLSLLLGRQAGLDERELADLALGALAHDAGKGQIPGPVLQTARRRKFEEDFYRQHVQYSVQLAAQSGVFTPGALAVIADHHETVDGTGWPRGYRESGTPARILALVNRFDRLCTPEAADREALTPSEALAFMFRHESNRFDAGLLGMFVSLLGVYPPGTYVKLGNGALAMVVSPGQQSLQPRVLVYSPEMSRRDAPILDLGEEADLKIVEALRPEVLPPDVLDWLNPLQSMTFFYSVHDDS
jgi:HD-GYP domain-containing protein (c-di-GMP phosphodiesterase class II)